ncbi:uncharacterized protein C8Q71DRAFT_408664 [Rhodofomes roseus]|uniref:F-box domain-containing protein n=1 Tax=Rhodofomes roseus TaxID=34475 RepID=A0ABQ8JYM3_9APHY|nr:uncharacterized protein C8Q71DRAFT_408664 [Rhodofomes roseus]KAH9829367.1 hypothetical protein C8Q71DRAFT_408664 [Rhodofomes roseus]
MQSVLNEDVWATILNFTQLDDARSLSLVSRGIHSVARRIVFGCANLFTQTEFVNACTFMLLVDDPGHRACWLRELRIGYGVLESLWCHQVARATRGAKARTRARAKSGARSVGAYHARRRLLPSLLPRVPFALHSLALLVRCVAGGQVASAVRGWVCNISEISTTGRAKKQTRRQ